MREISIDEAEFVEGGGLVGGAVSGAIAAGAATYISGGNAAQVAAATILGGVAGFFGSVGMYGSAAKVSTFLAFTTFGGGGSGSALRLIFHLR